MKSRSTLLLSTIAVLSFAAVGCKGETKYKDSQQTLDELNQTRDALKEKTELVKTLSAQVSEYQLAEGAVVINMEGPRANGEPGAIIEIKGRGPNSRGNGGTATGNAKDTELYDAFVAKVRASRGSVKKCYEIALKKRSDIQNKSVTLAMTVDYRTSGAVASSSFAPSLTPEFNSCMSTVASRWKLPAMPQASRFTYRQKLTPQ